MYRETTVTSAAGGGTNMVEFAMLSRVTKDPKYEIAARRATVGLWSRCVCVCTYMYTRICPYRTYLLNQVAARRAPVGLWRRCVCVCVYIYVYVFMCIHVSYNRSPRGVRLWCCGAGLYMYTHTHTHTHAHTHIHACILNI